MQEEQQTIHFNLAHDGGNGYMKDRLNGKTTIFPSVIADFMPGMQNITVDSASRDDVESFLDDFIDNMDITTNSKGISDNGRFLVGQAAAYSGVHVTTFNVNNTAGKNTSDISVICALAFIAYNALNIYYRHHLVLLVLRVICIQSRLIPLINQLTFKSNLVKLQLSLKDLLENED